MRISVIKLEKMFGTCLFACMSALLCSCEERSDTLSVDAIPVMFDGSREWSLLSFMPEEPRFEFSEPPTYVINGFFNVEATNGTYVYNFNNGKCINATSAFKVAGIMSEDLIPVVKERQRIEVIDADGNFKFSINQIDNKEILYCSSCFKNGLLLVKNEDGKYGYIDKSGKPIITPQYDQATSFVNGYAVVGNLSYLDKESSYYNYWVIDNNGNTEKLPADGKAWIKGNFIVMQNSGNKWGCILPNGKYRHLTGPIGNIEDVTKDGKCPFYSYETQKWGVLDIIENSIVIPPNYDYICVLPNGEFLVEIHYDKKNDGYDMIDGVPFPVNSYKSQNKIITKDNRVKYSFEENTISVKYIPLKGSDGVFVVSNSRGEINVMDINSLHLINDSPLLKYSLPELPVFGMYGFENLLKSDYKDPILIAKRVSSYIGANTIKGFQLGTTMQSNEIFEGLPCDESIYFVNGLNERGEQDTNIFGIMMMDDKKDRREVLFNTLISNLTFKGFLVGYEDNHCIMQNNYNNLILIESDVANLELLMLPKQLNTIKNATTRKFIENLYRRKKIADKYPNYSIAETGFFYLKVETNYNEIDPNKQYKIRIRIAKNGIVIRDENLRCSPSEFKSGDLPIYDAIMLMNENERMNVIFNNVPNLIHEISVKTI